MRVIAGTARSLPLKAPLGEGTRPTTDRIKETLFNMLQGELLSCVFVDLFAGSGGIGIEAISRGAKRAYFIENAKEACGCIEQNLAFTKFKEQGILLKMDALAALSSISEKEVDIIFMDPPYDMEHEKRILAGLAGMKYVTDNTLIIVEASLNTKFDYLEDYGFECIKEKKYKTNQHVFIQRKTSK